MRNYDRVGIEGNATREPVLRKTKTGKSVCSFSIAINHYSREGAEPSVSYVDVETWEKLAEICARSVNKGKRVMVFGSLRQDRWQDEDGNNRSKIKVVGSDIRFLEMPVNNSADQSAGAESAAV